jgi:DNA-directed RNA polymerase sigma subunit (sigma70/sigma32)
MDDDAPVRMYLREVLGIPPLKEGEEADLLRDVRSQDEQAELATKRLIEVNLYLVATIAERHSSQGLAMLELIQVGNMALMPAIDSFSSDDETFVSYAAICIEDAIAKAIAESRSAS